MVEDIASAVRLERAVVPDRSILTALRASIDARLRSPSGRDFHNSPLYRHLMTHGLQHVFSQQVEESRLKRLVRMLCVPPTTLLEHDVVATRCCVSGRESDCYAARMVGEPTVYRVSRRWLHRLTAAGRLLHLARFFVATAMATEEYANILDAELARIVADCAR